MQMAIQRLGLSICVFTALLNASDTPLWTEYVDNSRDSVTQKYIPDFSYAGYMHGDRAMPSIGGRIFDVTTYGAIANDDISDSIAIQNAIDACGDSGGGVVVFPKGIFIINDNELSTSASIRISKSNIVLRGSGSSEDGTILYSPKEMLPVDPAKMYTGRSPIVVRSREEFKSTKTAKIIKSAELNSRTITIEESHSFYPGDRITIRMLKAKGNSAEKFIRPMQWSDGWTNGVGVTEFHEIASVEGGEIALAEPIMFPIDTSDSWTINEAKFISEIGFENLRVRGSWQGDFVHHRSWRDDSGWVGVEFRGVENGWIVDCAFENLNHAIRVSACRQMTLQSIDILGNKAHFGVSVSGSYGVLCLKVRDLARHHHGPSVEAGACATVFHRCSWSPEGSFDSHACHPYATLHDRNEGGIDLSGVGGNVKYFPHHLHGFILWNFTVTKSPANPVDFWSVGKEPYAKTFVQVLIAGLSGQPVKITPGAGLRNESQGNSVTPSSLWLAQLHKRLGALPPHFEHLVSE